MRREYLKGCAIGALCGALADYVIAIAASYILRLGYFAPCLAALPERVGGEMNAVVLQLALCALIGAGIGSALSVIRRRKGRAALKALLAIASFIGFLMPAVVLAAGVMK